MSYQFRTIQQELTDIKERVYNPLGFKCSRPIMELESVEYGANRFELNNCSIKFRVAKITPT